MLDDTTKNYTSNYDYIKSCNIEQMADLLATLTATFYEVISGKPMEQTMVLLNYESAKEWLKQPAVSGEYLM